MKSIRNPIMNVRYAFFVVFLMGCFLSDKKQSSNKDSEKAVEIAKPPFDINSKKGDVIFTWYDKEGIHIAKRVEDIPQESRQYVRVDSLSTDPKDRTSRDIVVGDLRNKPYRFHRYARDQFDKMVDKLRGIDMEELASVKDVIVYMTAWCSVCRRAMDYLDKKGIPYEKMNIEKDSFARSQMQKKLKAAGLRASGVPVIDFKGTMLTGFNPEILEKLIAQKKKSTLSL